MRATTRAAVAVAALLGAWLGWTAWIGALTYDPLSLPRAAEATPAGYPWRGAVHVHTELSADAGGALEQIVAAAAAADLDFVVIADHTQAQGSATRVHPGWHDRVLVVVAEEISTDKGHLLAFGTRAHPYALGPTVRQAMRDITELGGAAVIAHPVGGEAPWRDGQAGAVGQEIVSLSSALRGLSLGGRVGALLAYPASPDLAALRLLRTRPASLDLWDRQTRLAGNERPLRLAGLGSVDAHGPIGLGVPGYEATFRALTTVVWMEEPPGSGARGAPRRLTDRLLAGRAAVVVSAAGNSGEISFVGRGPSGAVALPGDVVHGSTEGWTLIATVGDLPAASLQLLRDGEAVETSRGGHLQAAVPGPGTYRLEAYRDDIPFGGGHPGATPWITTNPIYFWPAGLGARPRPAPALPSPGVARSLLELTGWAAETGGEAMSALGLQSGGLRWRLRLPTDAAPEAYAALAWRPESGEAWTARRGVAVGLRSQRPWRVSLRVWTRAGGSTQTWEAIVSSGPAAPPVAVPWEWFRRTDLVGAGSPERLDTELAEVTGLALVVTPQLMRSGSEATIEVTELGPFGAGRAAPGGGR